MRHAVRLAVLPALALAMALGGCNDNQLGATKRRPNLPPVTTLSSGPPDSTYGTSYKVHLFWSGADPDGIVDHYDFILVDHAAIGDSISTTDPNAPDRVDVEVPLPEDPRWTATSSNDTLVISKADTLRHDPLPPICDGCIIEEHDQFIRLQRHERWHTFFVRAVDNEGQVDLSPDYRSFNSTTLAPDLALKLPVDPHVSEFKAPRVVVFNWDGLDPVGDGTFIPPVASRWVMIPTIKVISDYPEYPRALYRPGLPWSPWRRWDATDKSGVRAIVRNLLPTDGSGERGYYLFAAQAMDEAGAVTPVFDAKTANKNNVALVSVTDLVGPTLTVTERFLGTFNFVGESHPVILAVAAGQPISFRWRADASSYGGDIVAYRFGWNIQHPENDEEWEQNWCATCKSAQVRIYNSGTQRFFLETRDNAETITHAEIELVVNQVTRGRNLLVVDDAIHFTDADERLDDGRWTAVIDSLRRRRPFEFDPVQDIYDVAGNRNESPPLNLVFNYKTIVWNVRKTSTSAALSDLAIFFDPFVEANRNAAVRFNYLSIYVDNGGEFWLSGQQPTEVLWSFGRGVPLRPYPINITNWDDYQAPHPDQDSVGVPSLLWKLGAEVVDSGSGGRQPPVRDPIDRYCTGFRRSTPQGYDQQAFKSTIVQDHIHTVNVLTADVDNPPLGGVTYASSTDLGHSHDLTLTQAQLKQLARGDKLTERTLSQSGDTPHTHTVELVDQVGLWGAPARLDPETTLWAQPNDPAINPDNGRPFVEIYNMGAYLAGRQPPLRPDPAVWVSLYSYVSPKVADPTTGVLYPVTADGQPAIILRKSSVIAPYYSRALCGFEMFRLRPASHLALADNILLRQFRLGLPDGP